MAKKEDEDIALRKAQDVIMSELHIEVEGLQKANKDLEARLKDSIENESMNKQALRSLNSRYEAMELQLQKLAYRSQTMAYFNEREGLKELLDDNGKMLRDLETAQRDYRFMAQVRDENSLRISELRSRIQELEAGLAPEVVALTAELNFWRSKAKDLLQKAK